MRESFTAGCRVHDRRANVIRHQCSEVTKSPRSDMFQFESIFFVDVKLADGWDGGQASSKDLRPMCAIKRAKKGSCRSAFTRCSF